MVSRLFKNYRLSALLCVLLAGPSLQSFAQLVSPDAFLKGRYVEVGVASNGTFGSANNAPTGFHGRTTGRVGFVADPDKDGWGVGTPAYFGDYFLPGGPYEAWMIQIDGTKTGADRNASTSGIGSNISVTSTGSKVEAVWEGTTGNMSMRQTTTLDTNNLYFVTTIKLKNTGTTTMNNIYYSRAVDPDNEQTLTGSYSTNDTIAFQTPNADHKSLVVAKGATYGAYLGLGAKDCRAKVYRSPYNALAYNLVDLYAGTTGSSNVKYSTTDAALLDDRTIGIIFNVGTLAAGDSTTLSYAYILKQEDLDAAFATVTPGWTINGTNYNSGDTVKACPGAVLPVSVYNGGSYSWKKWSPVTGLSDTTGATNNITVGTGTVVYKLAGVNTASVCDTTMDTISIVVKPLTAPAAPAALSPVSYCVGATATALTATLTSDTLKWYNSSNVLLPGAPTPATGTAGSTTYYVSQKPTSGCEGAKKTIIVNVTAVPAAPVAATPVSLCRGAASVALSATLTADTLKWYDGSSVLLSGAPTPSTAGVGTTTYYVSQKSAAGCESPKTAIIVNVLSSVSAPVATTPVAYCQGTTATALTATLTSDTLKWYNSSNVLLPGAPTPATGTAGSTVYYVSQKSAAGCESPKATITVTVNSGTTAPVTTKAISYCQNAPATALSATLSAPADTLKWYDATGALLPAAPTPLTTTVGRTTYYVSEKTTSGCESLKDTIFVSVNPNPVNVTATPSGSIMFCAGDSVTLVGSADVTTPTGMTGFASAGAAGGTVTTCDCPSGYVAVGYEGNTGSWMDHFTLLCKKLNRDGTLGTTTIATATNGTSYGGGYNGPYTYAGSDMLVGLRVNSQGSYLNAVAGYGHDYAYIAGYGSNPAGATSLAALSGATPSYDLGYLWAPDGTVVTGMAAYNASYYSSGVALRYTPVGAFKYKYSWSTGGDTTQNKVVKTSGSYTLTVTNSYGCPAQSATVNVTVNPLPVAVTTTTNVVYCQNATATALTATKTSATDTLKWYNAANTLLSGAPTPVTTTAGTTTYYVSQKSAAGCEGPKTTITVKVNPVSAVPTTTTPIVYCQNATASVLTATLATAADTMKWYNAANTLLSAAPTPVTTSAGTTLYYVSEKNAFGCESPKVTITVKVNPTPDTAATTKAFTYCEGVPATVLSAVRTSDSLKWYDGSSVLLPAAPTPPTTTAGTYTYYVSQKNTFGCEGLKTKITVTVNPTPAAPVVTTPVNLCQGGPSAALTATGINLKWYTAPASGTASTTAPVPPTLALGTTPYYVSQTSALNCESSRSLINVVVNPIPAAPAVTSPVELCINVPAAALTATGINLKWYTAASGGTGSATAPVPVTTTTGTTNFYVSQTSIVGCESPRATITANVHPSPVLHISPLTAPAFAYCPGAEVTIKATTSTVISYQWYKNALAITGAVTDTLSVGVNGWYAMLVTDMYGCKTKDSVFVFQDTLPAPKLSPTNVQICTGVTIMMYCTPADAGYKYEWYKEATAMSMPLTTNSIPVNITGLYHVKVTDYYGCSSLTNNALVTNYPAVAKPVIDRKDPVLRVTPAFPSYQWYRNGVAISGATASSYIMKFDGTYYVEVMDINGCTNVSDPVVVERLAISQVPAQLPEIKIYPNPTQSVVTIECPVTVNVLITDISGRSILKSEHCTQVDMSNYADGMYLFHIFDEQGTPLRIEKINKTAK